MIWEKSKKVASFEDTEAVSIGLLRGTARNIFHINCEDLILQRYDATFEEYIDAADDEVVNSGEKVKVVQQPIASFPDEPQTTGSKNIPYSSSNQSSDVLVYFSFIFLVIRLHVGRLV